MLPVGRNVYGQTLIRVRRTPDGDFEEESLIGVAFVRLIGAHAWEDD